MTVKLTFDPQFTERTVQITHIVFPRRSHYGSTTLQANKKIKPSSDERFSSLNTKLEPTVNFDCKKCLKLLRFLALHGSTHNRMDLSNRKSASRHFSFASSHEKPPPPPPPSIHPRIQSIHPTKHVNSDWVRVCSKIKLRYPTQIRLQKIIQQSGKERKQNFQYFV